MKRTFGIVLSVVVWLAIVAYLVTTMRMCQTQQKSVLIKRVEIKVLDRKTREMVTPDIIRSWLSKKGYDFNNSTVSKINTHEVTKFIESHNVIKSARVYSDMDGTLHIEIKQRQPIMRINSTNGYNLYITDDDWVISSQQLQPIYVPIITGHVTLPFDHNYEGSITTLAQKLEQKEQSAKKGFEKELHNIFILRETLRSGEAPKISTHRKERKRINKMRNESDKTILLKELDRKERGRVKIYRAELHKIEQQQQQIILKEQQRRVKQIKEQQNYLYLHKLINFVETVTKDSFWTSQIVQINIRPLSTINRDGSFVGSSSWIEPEIELTPRIGKHIVLFGTLEDRDAKLDKLMLFYDKVLNHQGWDRYKTINLKYRGQIVCQ